MTKQELFNLLIAIVGAFGGWWLKLLSQSLRDLKTADEKLADKVGRIEVLVAGEYVKVEVFENKMEALFKKLDRIEDKLDKKVDK